MPLTWFSLSRKQAQSPQGPDDRSFSSTVTSPPGGSWDGLWNRPSISGGSKEAAKKSGMRVRFRFANGALSGIGDDEVGDFVVRGSYCPEKQSCKWTLSYIPLMDKSVYDFCGSLSVIPHGFRRQQILMQGSVKLEGDAAGTFSLVSRQKHVISDIALSERSPKGADLREE